MPKEKRDYYEILGLPSDAEQKEIEKAFHTLALRYHPDRNKEANAAERFKEASEAYAVLSDPEKRREYDARGFAGVAGYSHDDLFGGLDLGSFFTGHGLDFGSGFFDGVFGRRRHTGPRKGANIEVHLTVPLECILNGGRESVHVARPETCSVCHGSRAKPGTDPRPCETCSGSGQNVQTRREGNATFQQITTCQVCHGRGQIIDEVCPECNGRGEVERTETLAVKIPPGIDDGQALRIAGRGHPSPDADGVPGDLYVSVTSKVDPRFERRGPHLWRPETIGVPDAVLGTSRSIASLDGEATVTIPAGTQPDCVLSLPGAGLSHFGGGGRGDLYILVRVQIPDELSEDERALYEQLRQLQKSSSQDEADRTYNQEEISTKGEPHGTHN